MPAVDLRDGACVQLVGGSYEHERVRIADPASAAYTWIAVGFRALHVVDLDAATGRGSNAREVATLIAGAAAPVQVGGGVRTSDRVAELLRLGASRIVVGTRAIEDRRWLDDIASRWPDRIVVAADVRGRRVVTHGWTRDRDMDIAGLIGALADLPLAGLLVTAVHREGLVQGTDLPLMEEIVQSSAAPVFASGGISSLEELRALQACGTAAAVLGMSLYTGAIDPRAVAEEFAE